jgi:hypothetical protein
MRPPASRLPAATNPIGRRVKLADLHDNSDLSRIAMPSERDFRRMEKYRRAIDLISRGSPHKGLVLFPIAFRHRLQGLNNVIGKTRAAETIKRPSRTQPLNRESRNTPKARAVCGNPACTDLCGGAQQ